MLLAVTLILLTDVFDRWSVPIADTDFAYYRTHFMSDVGRMASNLEIKPRPTRGLPLSRWVGR
jgi:hypothetical protein